MSTDSKIVIIGAGAAGIAAASRLLENGFTNVIVLEDKHTIGGRIKSVFFGDAFVDLGAEFCHGENGNVVFESVKDLNVLEPDPSNPDLLRPHSQKLENGFKDSLFDIYNNIYCDDKRQTEDSLGEYFTQRFLECLDGYSESEQDIAKEVLDVFRRQIARHDGAFSWFDAAGTADYSWCEGLTSWNWNGRGYKTIIDALLKKVSKPDTLFHLGKDVVAVNWGEKACVVCEDGSVYPADHVIVTVSLGVLKSAHNALFNPVLPRNKVEAIERLQIGSVAKVFFYFSKRWWSDTFTGALFVWPQASSEQGPLINGKSWVRDILGIYPVPQNPNVLKMWFVGKMVPEIEKCPEEIIVDGLMYVLELFLGDQYPNLSRPDEVLRYNWYSDRCFQGTYSFQGLETRKGKHSDAVELSLPLYSGSEKPIVLFAGEATHPKYYSTVHGAIESGFREADRLICLYNKDYSS